jgi:hypothetical protein
MRIIYSTGLALLAFAGLSLPAQAQLAQIHSAGGLSAGDSTLSYSGMNGDLVSSPFVQAGSGNTLTFIASGVGTTLTRIDSDGSNFDFAAGTTLLETTAGGFAPDGPLVIEFAKGVTEFGLSAQNYAPDTEAFSFIAYDGNKLLGGFSTDLTDNHSDAGAALFLGGAVTGGNVITRVSISSVSSQHGASNDFLAGPVTYAAVPEASTAASVGLGTLLLLGCFVSARKRTAQPN